MRKVRAGLAAAIPLVIAMTASAGAEVPDMHGAGKHTERVGLHWILDAPMPPPEHAAVVCRYDATSRELVRMVIRQPVIFADVSRGPRTQRVGWQAVVQHADDITGPWQASDRTPLQRASATGKYPADFRPEKVPMPGDVGLHPYYRVVYRLYWYAGDGTRVADRAIHRPVFYSLATGSNRSYLSDHCESRQGIGSAGTVLLDHTGRPGPHWILDHYGPEPEYPAVTCEYDSTGELVRMGIRRPIVLARDTGGGVQRGDVAWRAIIQMTPQNSTHEEWTTIARTRATRRPATDLTWADFLPKTYEVADPGIAIGLRVVYRISWYRGTTAQKAGSAEHLVAWYRLDHAAAPSTWEDDYCYVALP